MPKLSRIRTRPSWLVLLTWLGFVASCHAPAFERFQRAGSDASSGWDTMGLALLLLYLPYLLATFLVAPGALALVPMIVIGNLAAACAPILAWGSHDEESANVLFSGLSIVSGLALLAMPSEIIGPTLWGYYAWSGGMLGVGAALLWLSASGDAGRAPADRGDAFPS